MPRDPGSLWSPLAENGRQGNYAKDKFIVHSTGDRGTAEAIYRYFNRKDIVVESTFVVGRGPEDPTRQLLDSSSLADANLGANKSGIAVEVVGTADDDYTDWQVSEIIRLGRWAKANHPIEPRICPTPTASGFGWHVMFGAPGPWTPVAKACPGKLRIQRLQERVFPAIFNPEQKDIDMTPEESSTLHGVSDLLSVHLAPAIGRMDAAVAVMFQEMGALRARVDALSAPAGVSATAVVDEIRNRLNRPAD